MTCHEFPWAELISLVAIFAFMGFGIWLSLLDGDGGCPW